MEKGCVCRVQQILTGFSYSRLKDREIGKLKHLTKCLQRKKCCVVLLGQVSHFLFCLKRLFNA